MAQIEVEVAEYLETQGVGTRGTDIWIGEIPDDTDDALTVIATGGFEPDPDLGDDIEYPTIQIDCRSTTYATAQTLSQAAHTLFLGNNNTTITSGGKYIFFMNPIQEPTYIGKDDKDRKIFSCNYRFIKHR